MYLFKTFETSNMELLLIIFTGWNSSTIVTTSQTFHVTRVLDPAVKLIIQKLRYFCAITAQKMKFSIKDFFSKCDQSRSFLRIWSHLLKKSLMKTSFLCSEMFNSVNIVSFFFDKKPNRFYSRHGLLRIHGLLNMYFKYVMFNADLWFPNEQL